LIFDEIPTGLGKTGRMFASEHFGVRPDITVLGKALGGGMLPIAAVIAAEALDCAQDLTLGHYTHEKNPVTASAGLATLDIIADESLVENAEQVGEHALGRLRRMAERSPLVTGVRGKGLLLAFDVRSCPASGRSAGLVAASLARRLFEGGLSLSPSAEGVLSMSAPLVIGMSQMDGALDLVEQALDDERRGSTPRR
jgi:4-aminobutyrate aminotransferase